MNYFEVLDTLLFNIGFARLSISLSCEDIHETLSLIYINITVLHLTDISCPMYIISLIITARKYKKKAKT